VALIEGASQPIDMLRHVQLLDALIRHLLEVGDSTGDSV
jgi:hypothetical protein